MERIRQAAVLGGVLLLSAAVPAFAQQRATELRVAVVSDVTSLDPQNHRDRFAQSVLGNLYDGLYMRMGDKVEEALVQETRQIDARTFELQIRQGIRFHSGDVLTVDDVKFTLDRIITAGALDGQSSPRRSLVAPLESVSVAGPDRIRLHLNAPWPVMRGAFSTEYIVNRRFAEAQGARGMATQVNGTGPFRLVAWNRGDNVVMERFPDYFGGAPGIPPAGPARVDRVVFRVIPETTSRVAALLAGEVDIATEVPVHMRAQIDRNARTRIMTTNGTRSFFISLNNTRPPFNDIRVRRAANHAIDRKLIIDRVLAGTATQIEGVLSPDSFAFIADLPAHRHDPALARRLLAEAGHPNGIDVTLDTIGALRDLAEAMAQMLTEVGIRTRVQVWEGAVLTPLWQNHERKERDMFLTSWGSAGLEPTGIMPPTLTTGARGNSAGFSNAEVDRLVRDAGLEEDDARRVDLYRQAQVIVNREAPWVFLWVPQEIYGVSRRVQNWAPQPSGMIYLHRATIGR
ncbi:MAG: ABC transporter substrate-binding protein [Variibacter sp.]|nr:ABC transporter substrate-binding protein [Variibacter sp.]